VTTSLASTPDWSVDPSEFGYDGTIVAVVHSLGQDIGASSDVLGAFVGEECRGVASAVFFPPGGSYVFMLRVYARQATGDLLTFQFYDASTDAVCSIADTIAFESDMTVGSLDVPYVMHIAGAGVPSETSGSAMITLSLEGSNPFLGQARIAFSIGEPGHVRLEIFDARGKRVATLVDRDLAAGSTTAWWDGTDPFGRDVSSGIYLCHLKTASHTLVQKMVLLR
jgi:hypothetical protein